MCVEVNGIRMRAFGFVKILPGLVFKKMDHEIRSYRCASTWEVN